MTKHGGARPGAGRPPLPASKRRRGLFTVAMTDAELASLRRAAREAGVSLARYAADVLVRYVRRRERNRRGER